MAMVVVGLLSLTSEAGLDTALVQASNVDEHKLRGIFGAVILIDFSLFAFLVVAAPAIAYFFDEDRLVWIIRVLALQFVLSMFAAIPAALLTRSLDFRRQSMIALAAAICGSLTTLRLALSGYGVWALVCGNLVTHLFNTVALNLVSPFLKWPHFSLKGLRGLIMFGGQVTAARVLWFLYSQADITIAGKLLGKESLGFYSVAIHLASLPVQKISAVINQVALPAFARSQHDPGLVAQYLLKAVRLLSFVSFPVLWGISSIAPEFAAVVLGPKWDPAVLPLQLVPLIMPLYFINLFLNTAFQGIGWSGVACRNALSACLIMPAAFWTGAHWGLLGLSLAWVIGLPTVMADNLRRMLPLLGLKFEQVLSAAAPAVLASVGMYASVAIARQFAGSTLGAPLLMALLIGVGVASYAVLARLVNRRGVDEIAELLGLERLLRRQGNSTPQ
jgi:O-antigen/teichoic acid export membrane protein